MSNPTKPAHRVNALEASAGLAYIELRSTFQFLSPTDKAAFKTHLSFTIADIADADELELADSNIVTTGHTWSVLNDGEPTLGGVLDQIDTALVARAPIASPAFTGNPTAPTQSAGNNSTRLATTAFVATAIADLVASSPSALDTLNELAAALNADANFATTVTTALAGKVPTARNVATQHSLTGGGDLTTDRTFNLVNDTATPGANKVYGTDGAGARGWKDDPAGAAFDESSTYFFDVAGNDTTGDGTANNPWLTGAPAVAAILSLGIGGTFYFDIGAGCYLGSLNFGATVREYTLHFRCRGVDNNDGAQIDTLTHPAISTPNRIVAVGPLRIASIVSNPPSGYVCGGWELVGEQLRVDSVNTNGASAAAMSGLPGENAGPLWIYNAVVAAISARGGNANAGVGGNGGDVTIYGTARLLSSVDTSGGTGAGDVDGTAGVVTYADGANVSMTGGPLAFAVTGSRSLEVLSSGIVVTGSAGAVAVPSGGTLTIPASSGITRVGAHTLTLTSSATTNATFPSGTITLAQLGAQTFTGTQTLPALVITGATNGAFLTSFMRSSGSNTTVAIQDGAVHSGTSSTDMLKLGSNATNSKSAGTLTVVKIVSTPAQSGTASTVDLAIERTVTSVGSGEQLLLKASVGGTMKACIDASGYLTLAGGLVADTTTGIKIGTGATQKLGFWNATPVAQQVLATGALHTPDDIITFLQTIGLCKQS